MAKELIFKCISVDPKICHGQACVKGLHPLYGIGNDTAPSEKGVPMTSFARFMTVRLSFTGILGLIVLLQIAASGCSVTRYTDGPLSRYLTEPIPKPDRPLARTLSLEKVEYLTSVGMGGIVSSDLVAREIYILPKDVGREVKELLKLDEAFSEEATIAGLNAIAKNRAKARQLGSGSTITAPPTESAVPASQAYIDRQEAQASEAYARGDYLKGNIHSSAATNALIIQQSFGQAQASVNLAFSVLGAAAAVGKAIIQNNFLKLRNWIEAESGAIGPGAPEGAHLSVFFLRFFDAKSFQLDSRNRVAVYLVLIDKDGNSTSVLEGSDILVCANECNLFQPKPTAKIVDKAAQSEEVQKQYWTPEGTEYLLDHGFDPTSAYFEYLLLQHGLAKLRSAHDKKQ